MKDRYLSPHIQELCFDDGKMAFLTGPRQTGKTTLAKLLLKKRGEGAYYNWDDIDVRRKWNKDPKQFIPEKKKVIPLVVFNEIHKIKTWKRTLKGVYDSLKGNMDIAVTGSARLDVYRKGGDSLLGRHFTFHLHPFSLGELAASDAVPVFDLVKFLKEKSFNSKKANQRIFYMLMKYGGFPDPFLSANDKKARLWRRMRLEKIIREDVRDLTRISELSNVEIFAALLPEKVGSPFSLTSLREDMEVSYDTVKRWHKLLQSMYYHFEIKPWSHRINRSLKKEGKIYLWDYSEVEKEQERFENLIASHLLKACHFWNDTGEGLFRLHYLRNKEKQEIDFLITSDNKPWLPVEAKLSQQVLSPSWKKFMPALDCGFGLQVVAKPGVWKIHKEETWTILVASACDVLPYLI